MGMRGNAANHYQRRPLSRRYVPRVLPPFAGRAGTARVNPAFRSGDIGGPPGVAGTCAALDPALWFFGKYGCSHCEKMGRRVHYSS